MKANTWKLAAVLLSVIVLGHLVGMAEESGVAPLGIIPTPPESTELEVRIWVDKGAYELGESITVHYSVNQPAYVYIWDILPDGTTNQILPNAAFGETDNYKTTGEYELSGVIEPPTGTEYLQILASTTPIDPFAYWTGDPGTFIQQLQVQILGIVPEAQRSWDFTSFEIVSGDAPSYGILTVNSTPSGAQIWISGSYVGYTPRTVYVPQGYQQVTITKTGYASASAAVYILPPPFRRTINVTLTPIGPAEEDPNAAFTYAPTNPAVGSWVQFDASSSSDPDGSIVSYAWSYGDGYTDSALTPTAFHSFGAAGTYVVTLTVTDDDGHTDTMTQAVQVGTTNLPPVAAFTFSPTNPAVGSWAQFNASSSSDPDGSIVSYAWNYGDGHTNSAAIPTDYHAFTAAGTYTVTLTVTDDDGATNSVSRTIQVGTVNLPPVAAFTLSPTNPAVGGWVQFNASSSSDPDGSIVSYAWSYGDGGTDSAATPTAYHPFSAAGTYTVTLTVTDDDGATNSISRTIQVGTANLPPIAAFTFTPTSPSVGEYVRFDAYTSSDPDGTITSYRWSYGDGTAPVTSSVPYAYHPFAAGTYTVTLTVTDNDGATDTTSRSISVGVSLQPPVAAFTYAPVSPVVGQAILFNAQTSYDPDGSIVSYLWDLDGDGVDDLSGSAVQITYTSAGTALVRLTVVDNDGLSSTATQAVVVSTSGGTPGKPLMGSTAGIFVWGVDRWHLTVNAGAGWTSARSYRLEVKTNDGFTEVSQGSTGGVAPLGIIPTPTDGGRTLVFEGSLQSGSVDYSFRTPESSSIWMKLQLDIDGNGSLDTSTSFVHLRYSMVNPPWNPFVVALPRDSTDELTPSLDFRVGYAISYTETSRFIFTPTSISALEGP